MNNVISNYIIEKYKTEDVPTAKQFEVHKIYGTETKDNIITVYLYSMYTEILNLKDLEIQPSHAYPVLIRLKKSNSSYAVTDYEKPESGYYYPSSIEKMFPRKYAKQALKNTGQTYDLTKRMNEEIEGWVTESKQ
jgi:hypothetical protein